MYSRPLIAFAVSFTLILSTAFSSTVMARRSGGDPGISYVAYSYPDLSPETWDDVRPWTRGDGRELCGQGVEPQIDFDWEDGSVFACGENDVAVQFTGYIQVPRSGLYTFYNESDDGFILKINRRKVVSDWESQGPETYNGSGRIYLLANARYSFEIWYFEDGGGAELSLYWSRGRMTPELVPGSWLSH